MTSNTRETFFQADTRNPFGFSLPGISDSARQALAECLEDNHNHHHIFFNDKGFHNHLTHHLLAALSLGASAERLRALHGYQSGIQLPIKPTHAKQEAFAIAEHWGDGEYYHDYLEFFTREILERDGGDGRRTVERWMFEEEPEAQRAQFYARCLSGAYHCFIHLGYGLEFNLNCMIAEGLAQGAATSAMVAPLLYAKQVSSGTKSAKEVVLAVAEDKSLDGKTLFDDPSKLMALLTRDGGPIIQKHILEWKCPQNQLQEKAHELQQLAVAALGGAVRPDKMHAVTSSIFLPAFVASFRPETAAQLLRDKFAVDLAYFVSRGRPHLNLDQLLTYQAHTEVENKAALVYAIQGLTKEQRQEGHENPWFGIWQAVLGHNQDEHIVKTIRALSYADRHHRDMGFLGRGAYLGVARMVVDNITPKHSWDHMGVGFEETWKDVPARSQ